MASRLGPLKVRVANNLAFDARQKIKRKQSPPKTRITVQDARQKISLKTNKPVDARVRIQSRKKASAGDNSKKQPQPGDMRIKINNIHAKKSASLIKTSGAGAAKTQVTLTGEGNRVLTKPGGGVQQVRGNLIKVITQKPSHKPIRPVKVSYITHI